MSKDKADNLTKFSDALKQQSKERHEANLALTAKLGDPEIFIPLEDATATSQEGFGYWRIKSGVVSYRMTFRGIVIPESRMEYSEKFIALLHGLLSKSVHTVES